MAVSGDDRSMTNILVKNIHCASCVSYIHDILACFDSAVHQVDINILAHDVRILHRADLPPLEICRSLADAAFEVYSVTITDKHGTKLLEHTFPVTSDGWLEAATDLWKQAPPRSPFRASSSCLESQWKNQKNRHLKNCTACQTEELDVSEIPKRAALKDGTPNKPGPLRSGRAYIEHDRENEKASLWRQSDGIASSLHTVCTNVESNDSDSSQNIQQLASDLSEQHSAASGDSPLDSTSPEAQERTVSRYSVTLSIGGMTCASCSSSITRALERLSFVESAQVNLMTCSAIVKFDGARELSNQITETVEDVGFEASITSCDLMDSAKPDLQASSRSVPQYEAVLSIGGMTCASCTSAITHGLQELPYIDTVSVTLMTNSAAVKFSDKENLEKIVENVEDLGYDCAVERCDIVRDPKGQASNVLDVQQRTVTLKIDGIFCKHCPPRIAEALSSKYACSVTVDSFPTLTEPILKLTYVPEAPDFTIRNIIATIDEINESFHTTIYHPPSLEERSRSMQIHEQRRLLKRLLLSLIIALPTFLIGVVWTSLLPSSNKLRLYWETSAWGVPVTRMDWSLFILATPVFFFAADVFHIRAIKEIRALWRRGGKVPVLRRFYRFGSMNLLISCGTSVAYFASLALLIVDATTAPSKSQNNNTTYFDSVVFLTFFILIGRYLEAYSRSKTGNAVAMLGNLRPQEAIVLAPTFIEEVFSKEIPELENNGSSHSNTKRVNADLLEVGDIVVVPHGSVPPADGVIVSGSTSFDESSLTGESRKVAKSPGDKVFAGGINTGSPVSIEVTEVNGTSMLDQIISVVREGQTKRAPVEHLADVLTGYFVPLITALAILTFVIWFSLGQSGALASKYLDGQQGGWAFWSLEFAIAVFVVACPCGLGLAAPTALFVGGGIAAKNGILVRGGGEAFQEASNIDLVVFDKTGTLTEGGDLKVTDHEMMASDEEVEVAWSIARSLEETSSHPLARAILALVLTKPSIPLDTISISEDAGLGLRGTFEYLSSENTLATYEAALGSENLISSLSPSPATPTYFTANNLSLWKTQSKSVALLAIRRLPNPSSTNTLNVPWMLTAVFAIADPIRPSAGPTISALQSRGLAVYMLTGDNLTTATAVATTLNIPASNIFAGVLPTEKASKIRWLQDHGPKRPCTASRWTKLFKLRILKSTLPTQQRTKVAFIGDGINDAPALTTATVSISLSSGSDIALSSSSFVLLSPSLGTILTLFDLSRRVFRRVRFNFAWALAYNVCLVPVAAGVLFWVSEDGWRLGPVWASAAMAASSVSVVGSSLALRWGGGGRGREG
ncbi:hypothetical protein MMC12_001842 [Toensbergia leucococca]|nr:hypothetical protein [Toensbergia leucococca]